MARLVAPNGGSVEVADERVENLVRYGFSEPETKKAPAKKSVSSKSSSK